MVLNVSNMFAPIFSFTITTMSSMRSSVESGCSYLLCYCLVSPACPKKCLLELVQEELPRQRCLLLCMCCCWIWIIRCRYTASRFLWRSLRAGLCFGRCSCYDHRVNSFVLWLTHLWKVRTPICWLHLILWVAQRTGKYNERIISLKSVQLNL